MFFTHENKGSKVTGGLLGPGRRNLHRQPEGRERNQGFELTTVDPYLEKKKKRSRYKLFCTNRTCTDEDGARESGTHLGQILSRWASTQCG